MAKSSTSWKKGRSGNPKGRPLNPAVEELNQAIEKVQNENDCTLLEHFVRRAYSSDKVLIAVMRKLIGDQKIIDANLQTGTIESWNDLDNAMTEKFKREKAKK